MASSEMVPSEQMAPTTEDNPAQPLPGRPTSSSNSNTRLPKSIYLDGNAWGSGFYVGVQQEFEKRFGGPGFVERYGVLMQGDSAGALLGLLWALGAEADWVREVYLQMAQCGPAEMLKLRISDYHETALDVIEARYPDAHLRVRDRFQVGVTTLATG
eukprot:g5322.t1